MTGDDTVVVCADVIEHLADPRPLLGLLADCRHRGALVITSTPDRVRVRGADHKGPPTNPSHVREWALDEYVALLADHDLPCTYAGYTINNTAHRELKTIVTIHDGSVERARTSPDAAPPPVAILAAYNEADVIQEVAEDLLAQGCDLVLIDNWSDDGTWEAMSALSQRHPARVRTERFPADGPAFHYEWRDILRRKEEIAASFPGRWILHTDADEVRRSPFAGTNLAEGLAIAQRCRANRVGFNLVNLRPVDDRPFVPGTLAHHFGHFEFGSRPGHFVQAKAWLQGTHRVDLASSGGHMADFPGARDFPYKFLLQHYPIRSREHGRRKVLVERRGRWSPYERETLKWHSQYDGFSSDSPFTWSADGLHRFDESFFREHGLLIMTDILEKRLSGEFGHSRAPS